MNVTKWMPGVAWDATFVIDDEGSNARDVHIQLLDFAGNDLAVPAAIKAYLASDAAGLEISTDTPTTDTAIADGIGSLAVLTTSQAYLLVSEADGDVSVTITDTDAHNYYLVLVMPNGKLVVSAIIALAG